CPPEPGAAAHGQAVRGVIAPEYPSAPDDAQPGAPRRDPAARAGGDRRVLPRSGDRREPSLAPARSRRLRGARGQWTARHAGDERRPRAFPEAAPHRGAASGAGAASARALPFGRLMIIAIVDTSV